MRTSPIASLIVLVLFVLGVYFIFKGLYWILSFIGPVLLIAALILDYQTILNFLRWIGKQFRTQPLTGIAIAVLSVLGFPFVCGYLFLRAFGTWKIKQLSEAPRREREREFVDFEEVE